MHVCVGESRRVSFLGFFKMTEINCVQTACRSWKPVTLKNVGPCTCLHRSRKKSCPGGEKKKNGLPKDTGSASIKSALDRRQCVVGRLFNWRHGSVEGQYFALYLVKNWNRILL